MARTIVDGQQKDSKGIREELHTILVKDSSVYMRESGRILIMKPRLLITGMYI